MKYRAELIESVVAEWSSSRQPTMHFPPAFRSIKQSVSAASIAECWLPAARWKPAGPNQPEIDDEVVARGALHLSHHRLATSASPRHHAARPPLLLLLLLLLGSQTDRLSTGDGSPERRRQRQPISERRLTARDRHSQDALGHRYQHVSLTVYFLDSLSEV